MVPNSLSHMTPNKIIPLQSITSCIVRQKRWRSLGTRPPPGPLVQLLSVLIAVVQRSTAEHHHHQFTVTDAVGRGQTGSRPGRNARFDADTLPDAVQMSIRIPPGDLPVVAQLIIPDLTPVHLPPEDHPQRMIAQTVQTQRSHIPRRRVVAGMRQPGRIGELRIVQSQRMRQLVHLEHEQPDGVGLVLLVVEGPVLVESIQIAGLPLVGTVILRELKRQKLPEILRQGHTGIVTRGQQQSEEQIDDEYLLAAAQIGRSTLHEGGPPQDGNVMLPDANTVLLTDAQHRQRSHYLGQTRDLPPLPPATLPQQLPRLPHRHPVGSGDSSGQVLGLGLRTHEAAAEGLPLVSLGAHQDGLHPETSERGV